MRLNNYQRALFVTFGHRALPVCAVDALDMVDFPLTEVDQVGVEEDADNHKNDEQPQLLVGLFQSVEQRLESCKVADKFEDP